MQIRRRKLVENLIQFITKADHFWRDTGKEVEFIPLKDESMIPTQPNYPSKVGIRDVKGMIKFMEKYTVKRGFVITDGYEATEKLEDKVIIFVPLWKWVLGHQPKYRWSKAIVPQSRCTRQSESLMYH